MGANDKVAATFHGADPLDQIRARLAKAVDMGQWSARHPYPGGSWIAVETPKGFTNVTAIVASKIDREDAEFIANAPTDIRRLLNALDAVQEIKDQNFFDSEVDAGYSYGWNAALEEIHAKINEQLGD